jgi:hypothetical protein
MIRANPDDPLFFEYVWPPTLADLLVPDPIDDWDAGLVGYGVEDIRDMKRRVPLIELSNDLEQARQQAAEIWRDRTGLDPAEDPPEGYTIWDAGGGCKFSYRLSDDN